eukprot:2315903-Pyramimonas_sp.AAC.1
MHIRRARATSPCGGGLSLSARQQKRASALADETHWPAPAGALQRESRSEQDCAHDRAVAPCI